MLIIWFQKNATLYNSRAGRHVEVIFMVLQVIEYDTPPLVVYMTQVSIS
jgi:hypothetical protein